MTVGREHGGINRIVFGTLALREREVPNLRRIDHAHGKGGGVERGDDRAFVAAGGFAHDLRRGMSAQELEHFGVALGVIGQGVRLASQVEL